MHFKISGEHRKVIDAQKYIEFEDMFSLNQIEEVAGHIDEVLAKRARQLIETRSAQELFQVGRDLWRDDDKILNLVCNRGLAEIASQLFNQKTIHLAFDQALRTTEQPGFPTANPSTLQQKSCIQPLICAVLIRLSGHATAPFLPQKKENVVFMAPNFVIPWEIFFQEPLQSFLLIAYAPAKALYILEKNDVHVHALKKLGYGFGDSLNPSLHPILYK